MPPISLFGRHWRIASDDFVYSSVAEFLVRLGWIVIIVFIFIFHIKEVERLNCLDKEYQKTTIYLITSLVLLFLTCVNLLVLASQSARGSIFDGTNPKKRRWVVPLLYVNIFFTVGESLWTITGTFFVIKDYLKCFNDKEVDERRVIIGVLVVIGCTYILLFVKFVSSLMVFKPFGKHLETSSLCPEERQMILQQQSHEERKLNVRALKCLMPCSRDNHSINAFQDIADILSSIFHDQQMVMSDVMAGLVLINHKQRIENATNAMNTPKPSRISVNHLSDPASPTKNISTSPLSSSGTNISINPLDENTNPAVSVDSEEEDNCGVKKGLMPVDWSSVVHYYKFAAAAYGYWWYIIEKPCAHFCSLRPYLNCIPCRCKNQQIGYSSERDGLCFCNLAAIRAVINVELKDIVYFTNKNTLQEVPFFMVADEKTKSLVISLRGTLSLNDALTDLRAVPKEMADESVAGLDCRWKGHCGMVEAARKVYKILHGPDEENDALKVGPDGTTTSRLCLMEKVLEEYPDYTITVTGHSLGAGTASILAFMLRTKYPDIQVMCYAYSPPGGLLCEPAAKESEKFIVSVVVGQDLVPRLSMPNIHRLSETIRKACEQCRAPKYKILGNGFLALCCTKGQSGLLDEEVDRLTSPVHSGASTNSSNRSMSATSQQSLLNANEPSIQRIFTKMVLPGRIFHITPTLDQGFFACEKSREDFLEILVSPSMLNDHLPNLVADALRKAPAPEGSQLGGQNGHNCLTPL